MKLEDLYSLFINNIKEIHSAEVLIAEALPKMQEAATSPTLKRAFADHLRETQMQISRLENIAQELGMSLDGQSKDGITGILKEGNEIAESEGQKATKDAALIGAAQKVEHWEIASYGTVVSMAELMGHTNAMRMLQDTLDEEKNCDSLLNHIAEDEVNINAKGATGN